MDPRLRERHVAVLVADGFEDLEFWVPVMRLREEGAQVVVASSTAGEQLTGKNGLHISTDMAITDLEDDVWDAVVVPGGWAPDRLRRDAAVTDLVRRTHERGAVVGLICHAGLVGISAGIVKGGRATGSLGIKDDLVNAGAIWTDEAAFREGTVVWGRVVEDIPDFCRELVGAIEANASFS
jgi:protease I